MSQILDQHRDAFFSTEIDLEGLKRHIEARHPDGAQEHSFERNLPPAIGRLRAEITSRLEELCGSSLTVKSLQAITVEQMYSTFTHDDETWIRDSFKVCRDWLLNSAALRFLNGLPEEVRGMLQEEARKKENHVMPGEQLKLPDQLRSAYYVIDYYIPED
jgi:hypothetical protein